MTKVVETHQRAKRGEGPPPSLGPMNNRRNRFNISIGLLIMALVLAWPNGRPSYVALETWGNLEIAWWLWPALLLLSALLVIFVRPLRWQVFAFAFAGLMFLVIGVAVLLSVGPALGTGACLTATFGSLRIALDTKADANALRRAQA